MARSENVVHAHMFHVTWDNDSLVFCFAKSKSDQTGRNRDQIIAKHYDKFLLQEFWLVTWACIQLGKGVLAMLVPDQLSHHL